MSSTTDAKKKGIGAARNWVLSKFKNYAKKLMEEWKFFCKIKPFNLMEKNQSANRFRKYYCYFAEQIPMIKEFL